MELVRQELLLVSWDLLLESPGISNDQIDNDQDGIIDEKRDNDKGVFVGPTDGIDDVDMFLSSMV